MRIFYVKMFKLKFFHATTNIIYIFFFLNRICKINVFLRNNDMHSLELEKMNIRGKTNDNMNRKFQ